MNTGYHSNLLAFGLLTGQKPTGMSNQKPFSSIRKMKKLGTVPRSRYSPPQLAVQPLNTIGTLSLYATSYSPCRSGGSKCSSGTASGEPARKGIVAVIPSWYAYMSGQQVYIPGYGYGIIGDTGGGIPGTNWIDLGYNDDDYVSWHSWVTVYFLTPVPANILYTLN